VQAALRFKPWIRRILEADEIKRHAVEHGAHA
jgi:hypothetical protein